MGREQIFNFEEIVSNTNKRSKSAGRTKLPLIAVDECLNNKKVNDTVIGLCLRDIVGGADPLWSQLRERDDGELLVVTGSVKGNNNESFDYGKPVRHSSWNDKRVVTHALNMLIHSNVILLTENTKLDKNGLRRVLREEVAPRLEKHVSLAALFKRGKTSYENYLSSVVNFCENEGLCGGYKEVLF